MGANAPDDDGTSGHFPDQGTGTAAGGADEDNENEDARSSLVEDSSTSRDSENDDTWSWIRRDSNEHYTPRDWEDDNALGESF